MSNKEKSATIRHAILSLDVCGDAKDGWEINARYLTGRFVEIPENASDADALKLIRGALGHRKDARGYRSSPWWDTHEFGYNFNRNDTGRPAYATQVCKEGV